VCARASRPERGCARALLSLNWAAAVDWLRPRPVRWAKGSWRRERAAAEGEVGCCSGRAREEIPSSPRGIERERREFSFSLFFFFSFLISNPIQIKFKYSFKYTSLFK